MKKYFDEILENFDNPHDIQLRIMKSDGGFTTIDNIQASELLLSGPAGGLIGYARMANDFEKLSSLKIQSILAVI